MRSQAAIPIYTIHQDYDIFHVVPAWESSAYPGIFLLLGMVLQNAVIDLIAWKRLRPQRRKKPHYG